MQNARFVVASPVGPLGIETSGGALTRILFHAAGEPAAAADEVAAETHRQLEEYFAGRRRTFSLPLAPTGTPFQLTVWNALREIAYGETVSYGELSRRIGRPAAVRAVGAANGQNPIPIVIPCHRVIGIDGRLVGFGGGLEVKQFLLRLEQATLF
jgi:methylated-DNA-[protein]-cysteine S-methyltransferase